MSKLELYGKEAEELFELICEEENELITTTKKLGVYCDSKVYTYDTLDYIKKKYLTSGWFHCYSNGHSFIIYNSTKEDFIKKIKSNLDNLSELLEKEINISDNDNFQEIFKRVNSDIVLLSSLITFATEENDYDNIYHYINIGDYQHYNVEKLYNYLKKDYEAICNKIINNEVEYTYTISLDKLTEKEIIEGYIHNPSIEFYTDIDNDFFEDYHFDFEKIQTETIFDNMEELYEGVIEAFDKDYTFTVKINSYIDTSYMSEIIQNNCEMIADMDC